MCKMDTMIMIRIEWPKDEYKLLCANCNCSAKRNGWSKKEVPKLGRVLCSCFSCGCVSA